MEWILFKDEMPEYNKKIAVLKDKEIKIGELRPHQWREMNYLQEVIAIDHGSHFTLECFDGWAPLPEPSKEQKPMTFTEALGKCIDGQKVRRTSWPKKRYINAGYCNFKDNFFCDDGSYIKMEYTPSCADFHATDWIIHDLS